MEDILEYVGIRSLNDGIETVLTTFNNVFDFFTLNFSLLLKIFGEGKTFQNEFNQLTIMQGDFRHGE